MIAPPRSGAQSAGILQGRGALQAGRQAPEAEFPKDDGGRFRVSGSPPEYEGTSPRARPTC